jgi:hypothetical protein
VRSFESAAGTFRRRAWDWCFLSMAHRRLGHDAEARRCLAEAQRWVDEADRNLAADLPSTRSTWAGWDEGPVYRLLLKEAGELLDGGAGAAVAGGPAASAR